MTSTLTKKQVKTFRIETPDSIIVAEARFDDECGNGHNTFAITAEIYELHRQPGEPKLKHSNGKTMWLNACGCCHEEIAKHFPLTLAPLIKWHLCSTDGPMHYVANTVYHADQHGPTHAWVYHSDPPAIEKHCVKYCSIAEAKELCLKPCYSMEIDEKTAKVANLEHARSSAVWPDATDEELTSPGLEERLLARLPALMAEFQKAVESLGFEY